ncbi:MAG: hypothetical protein JWO88_3257 [Frankiales bacterium]|nr:hypothetical protein [Frankiales bacterium]
MAVVTSSRGMGRTMGRTMGRVMLGWSAVALMAYACNPDPTSGGFAFRIVNDTASPVSVSYCDNASCSRVDWKETVMPRQALPTGTKAQGFDEWYQFRVASTGVVLGCKTVNFSKTQNDVVIPVTSGGACKVG